ncbi:MAG: hypothetical protein P8020_18545 [Acidobacteriota bacterium]
MSRASRALLDQEMGLGEYEYIYVLASYDELNNALELLPLDSH